MFVSVLFGDSRTELFNLNCKMIYFIHNLKQRCGVDVKECVDLMDSRGAVMNLEAKQHSLDLASTLLAERQFYVLLRVCRNDESGGRTYVSLLNSNQTHPELAGLLRKLSNPKRRLGLTRRGHTLRSHPAHQSRNSNISEKS